MNRPFHILTRKLTTFGLTAAKCSNWPQIAAAKLGLNPSFDDLRFRGGFRLKVMQPFQSTWGEVFEPAIADLYGFAQSSDDLVVDVGANIGSFSCRAAFMRPSATIHAFEPSQRQAELLHENIALNRLTNVTVHRSAVTKDGRDVVFTEIGSGGGSGIFLHDGGPSVTQKSTTLDCVDYGGSASVFIKLDCEGTEGEIIEWICANRGKLPPRVRIAGEYHHWCPVRLDQIMKNLQEHDFMAQEKILFDEQYFFASNCNPAAGDDNNRSAISTMPNDD